MVPKVSTVKVVKTTNSWVSQYSVNPEMLAWPRKTVVNIVKTTSSLRSQYSVEVVGLEILAL
jgi:hypothetical protein